MKNKTRSLIRKLIISLSIASVVGGGISTYSFIDSTLDHRSKQLSLEHEKQETLNMLSDNHEYYSKYTEDLVNITNSFLNEEISAGEYETQKSYIGSLEYIEEYFLTHGDENAKNLINDLNNDLNNTGDEVFKNTIGTYVSLASTAVVPFSLALFCPKKEDESEIIVYDDRY